MTRVETNAETVFKRRKFNDLRQLFEARTEVRALTGGRFEENANAVRFRKGGENAVERFGDAAQPVFSRIFFRRAGMHHDVRDAENVRSNEFVRKSGARFFELLRFRRR